MSRPPTRARSGSGAAPTPGASSVEERIAHGLGKVGLALKHQAWQAAGERGLSPTQAQILTTLAGAGGLRPSELAARLAIGLATVSESVRALVDKGLARKVADPADARATRVELTATGAAEARQAAAWPDFLVRAAEAMSPAEQGVFLTGLIKMIRTLQERGEVPPSRMCVTCRYFAPHVHRDVERPHHCNFIDAPLAARDLRLDCADHDPAAPAAADAIWRRFTT